MEPRGEELVNRYKANYGIPLVAPITEEMILRHWELERRLRKKLLESTRMNRWKVFKECYSKLYGELGWLSQLSHSEKHTPPLTAYRNWADIVGAPPMRIYEVGSGKGELIHYLASCGFECKATEITDERGEKWAPAHPNLAWGTSDGIHLDEFEPAGFYDAVVSISVIEHLHPDDLHDHFEAVRTILRDGGRYIFSTPHASSGPSDISKVFGRNVLMGMHLKEYTYAEIALLLVQSGFGRVRAVIRVPVRVRERLAGHLKPMASRSYLSYLCIIERLIAALPNQRLKRKAASAARMILFAPNIMVVAEEK